MTDEAVPTYSIAAHAAEALTDNALAMRLSIVRDHPRSCSPDEREAWLTEAIRRLSTRKESQ